MTDDQTERSVPPLSELRWRCRRGMRELDVILRDYLDSGYSQADSTHQAAFLELLELPDPQILGYLLGREQPERADIATIVRQLRERTTSP